MTRFVRRFLRDEDGPTTVEYAVLLAGILVLCIAAISSVGGISSTFWTNNQQSIDSAIQNAQN